MDDVSARFEHEIKPIMQYVADKVAEAYDLPEGTRLEWVPDEGADRG